MKVHELIKALEGVDPNLKVEIMESSTNRHVDVNGVLVMPWLAALIIEY